LMLFTTATALNYVVGANTITVPTNTRSALAVVSEDILHGQPPGTIITATMRAVPTNTNYAVINHSNGEGRTNTWLELEELA